MELQRGEDRYSSPAYGKINLTYMYIRVSNWLLCAAMLIYFTSLFWKKNSRFILLHPIIHITIIHITALPCGYCYLLPCLVTLCCRLLSPLVIGFCQSLLLAAVTPCYRSCILVIMLVIIRSLLLYLLLWQTPHTLKVRVIWIWTC